MESRGYSHHTLDSILALQLLVGWAGEGECEPRRLGWWQTDVIDGEGGGYTLRRLLPETWPWATLECARRAAVQVERRRRRAGGSPEGVRTLFGWGWELDEALRLRLHALKTRRDGALRGDDPLEVLPWAVRPEGFDRSRLEAALRGLAPEVTWRTTPLGRELVERPPASPVVAARHLAAALTPFGESWPMPYFRVER